MWPELVKAKRNVQEITKKLDELLKSQNSLTKKEIAYHKQNLISEFDEAVAVIEGQLAEFRDNMDAHRNQLRSRSDFLKRHNYSVNHKSKFRRNFRRLDNKI